MKPDRPIGEANGEVLDAVIGVDVGGTHTDVAVIFEGKLRRGKALTTYDDFSRGVLEAIEVAAAELGIRRDALLARTRLLINGTTVVTNAITQLAGSHVGVLVTSGFRDTFRFGGGARRYEFDDHLQVNVPDVVKRSAIAEVEERIDYSGKVLVPLNMEQLDREVHRLVNEEKVEALAVCFLSSFANPAHEQASAERILALYPDLFVTCSYRVFPVVGENRRWTTAILNSFVQERAESYLESLTTCLRENGLKGGLAFFQGLGGGISAERAREYPLALLGSGPAGGAIGANELAKRMGLTRVLLGDMGGTSFDTGIIDKNELHVVKNLDLDQLETGVSLVDIVSIGAGGGSIAWVDERGVPQVGPQSAGSTPGPAAYGLGGVQPTVTDAMLTLGLIDPGHYLAGRLQLRPELSRDALQRGFCDAFGWPLEYAATAIHDLIVVNMANAMREVSVEKGYDPRDCAFFAYGGTLPLFCMQIATRLGIGTVIIPRNSSVFCALGLLASDFVRRYDQAIGCELDSVAGISKMNDLAKRMIARGVDDMKAEGFGEADIEVIRSADCRFMGQSFELTMPLPNRSLRRDDGPALVEQFLNLYERTYGEGTAWKGVPIMSLNYTVTVVGRLERPRIGGNPPAPASAGQMLRGTRPVYVPGLAEWRDLPVYDDGTFTPGSEIAGPAVVDAYDTTVYVPPGSTVARDGFMNYVMTRDLNAGTEMHRAGEPVPSRGGL